MFGRLDCKIQRELRLDCERASQKLHAGKSRSDVGYKLFWQHIRRSVQAFPGTRDREGWYAEGRFRDAEVPQWALPATSGTDSARHPSTAGISGTPAAPITGQIEMHGFPMRRKVRNQTGGDGVQRDLAGRSRDREHDCACIPRRPTPPGLWNRATGQVDYVAKLPSGRAAANNFEIVPFAG